MKTFLESPRFNTDIRYGSAGGPEFNTDITTVTSGSEFRLPNWKETRGRWSIGTDPLNRAQMDALTSMFRVCRGMAVGFRFKDWSDWYATKNQGVMLTVPGSPTLLQLGKAYSPGFGGQVTFRTIRKPVPGTISVWKNGVLVASPMIEYSTGLYVVGSYSDDDTFQWSGEFDVPARFDSDELNVVFEAFRREDGESMFTIQSLDVVEIMQSPAKNASGNVIAPDAEVVSTAGYVPPPMPEVPGAAPLVAGNPIT